MANPTQHPKLDFSHVMPAHGTVCTTPAQRWEDALVAGNGIMGALLFGNPSREILIGNHCKLWLPKGSRESVPDIGNKLNDLREVIGKSGYQAGQDYFCDMARQSGWDGKLLWTDAYHPGLFVEITQDFDDDIKDYYRIEDFSAGEVWTQWVTSVGDFSRRMFVSKTDNVIVLTTTGPPRSINQKIRLLPVDNNLIESSSTIDSNFITSHNRYVHGKGGFDLAIRLTSNGGTQRIDSDAMVVEGADTVTLTVRILPWKTPLPDSDAWELSPNNPDFLRTDPIIASNSVQAAAIDYKPEWLNGLKTSISALSEDFDVLLKPHEEIWRNIFDRVSIDLNGAADERAMSSELLLALAKKEHRLPAALLERMYDAGRYVYMCSAGPETPPNLYGIWTGTWKPEWSGDYTTDTNLQLDIESAYSGNMAELMIGYFNLWDRYTPDFELNAKRLYGCRGIAVGSRSSNNGLSLHWGTEWPGNMWTTGAAWMAHWHYDHFRYTGDRQFLIERAIPFMEKAALFWEDFLSATETNGGKFTFRPSYSAENDWGDNASQDIEIVTELFENLIEACRTLGIREDDVCRWQNFLRKLPSLLVNDEGQLQEFAIPGRADYNDHRHMMHLYWAFDAPRFSLDHDEKLYRGAQKALLNRIRYTTSQTSATHGRMQIALSALQLGMPNLAYTRLTMMAADPSMYTNMVTAHEPGPDIFCDDGNGAIPEVVNRMAIQSEVGRINVAPAVPDALPYGKINGLRARGQIEVTEVSWNTRLGTVYLLLTSEIDQEIEVIFQLDAEVKSCLVRGEAVKAFPLAIRRQGIKLKLRAGEPSSVAALLSVLSAKQ